MGPLETRDTTGGSAEGALVEGEKGLVQMREMEKGFTLKERERERETERGRTKCLGLGDDGEK